MDAESLKVKNLELLEYCGPTSTGGLIMRIANSPLVWTDAKPTVPGWYWYRDELGDHRELWGMLKYPGGETIFDEGFSHPLDEFAGPIPAPKEIPAK